MKNEKKKLHGFLYSKNKANFEAIHKVISSSINLSFLKSDIYTNHLVIVTIVHCKKTFFIFFIGFTNIPSGYWVHFKVCLVEIFRNTITTFTWTSFSEAIHLISQHAFHIRFFFIVMFAISFSW